jgi:hypothetical protein
MVHQVPIFLCLFTITHHLCHARLFISSEQQPQPTTAPNIPSMTQHFQGQRTPITPLTPTLHLRTSLFPLKDERLANASYLVWKASLWRPVACIGLRSAFFFFFFFFFFQFSM